METRTMMAKTVSAAAVLALCAAAPQNALAEDGAQSLGNGQTGSIAISYEVVEEPAVATVRTEVGATGGHLPKTADDADASALLAASAACAASALMCLATAKRDEAGDR